MFIGTPCMQIALRRAGEPCDMHGEMLMWTLLALGCLGDPPVAGAAVGPGDDRPVWMFERTREGWTRRAEPIAHQVSSLGLGVVGDRLVLTMQCFWGDCGSILHRHRVGPPVHALWTDDLETFHPDMARLDDPSDRVPIDTEMRDPDEVWYYGTEAGAVGDPAKHTQPHVMFKARREGDRIVEPVEMMRGPGLADPAPLTVHDETLLFVTTQPGHAIGVASGDPLTIFREWKGVSVPHAMIVEGEVWLWAQRVVNGRMIPVRTRSLNGGKNWGSWDMPLSMDGIEGCGNPVGAVFQGRTVVFCVTEPVMK